MTAGPHPRCRSRGRAMPSAQRSHDFAPNALMATAALSAWSPFSRPVFRIVWAGWLITNLCMWMNDVAAAWLMTSLSASPLMVALVQSASTLPVFLLGVPSGAIADIVDRRHILIFTQAWLGI